jgi:hypothetical protein
MRSSPPRRCSSVHGPSRVADIAADLRVADPGPSANLNMGEAIPACGPKPLLMQHRMRGPSAGEGPDFASLHPGYKRENVHILNTPNFVSGIGALSAAENASASTRRVSCGAMMPSSHSRAVA